MSLIESRDSNNELLRFRQNKFAVLLVVIEQLSLLQSRTNQEAKVQQIYKSNYKGLQTFVCKLEINFYACLN